MKADKVCGGTVNVPVVLFVCCIVAVLDCDSVFLKHDLSYTENSSQILFVLVSNSDSICLRQRLYFSWIMIKSLSATLVVSDDTSLSQ